jgi:hypothetical protein
MLLLLLLLPSGGALLLLLLLLPFGGALLLLLLLLLGLSVLVPSVSKQLRMSRHVCSTTQTAKFAPCCSEASLALLDAAAMHFRQVSSSAGNCSSISSLAVDEAAWAWLTGAVPSCCCCCCKRVKHVLRKAALSALAMCATLLG